MILGFAMQDLLSNVVAGFSIHTTRAYQVGDWLLISAEGKRAEVVEINSRSTRAEIRTALWYELGRRDMRIPFPTARWPCGSGRFSRTDKPQTAP